MSRVITQDDLIRIAQLARRCDPGDNYEARSQRARAFVAGVVGFLDENEGNQVAGELGLLHLVTPKPLASAA